MFLKPISQDYFFKNVLLVMSHCPSTPMFVGFFFKFQKDLGTLSKQI